MSTTTVLLIAAALVSILILGFVAGRWKKAEAVVAKVETDLETEALKLVMKSLDVLSDNTADTDAITKATANIQARSQRIAALKAKVQTLA